MARQSRLLKTYVDFICEIDELVIAFTCNKPTEKYFTKRWPAVSVNSVEGCTIRLYDSWNRFCRELIFQSAADLPLTANGNLVNRAIGVTRRADVLPLLISKLPRKPRYGEPRWADATECLNAAQTIGISNYSTVSAALGATPSPVDHLRITRNYVAHRNKKTAIELRSVAITYGFHGEFAESFVRHVVSPGITVYEKWISELKLLAELAVQ